MIAHLAFYVFSAILLLSAAAVVSARNAVHSVLFLILAFFNAAGLFLLAGAEFLAMILVIVYVGAVAVLFLFVVMMLDVNFGQLREGLQRYAPVGATVGVILLGELGFAFFGSPAGSYLTGMRVIAPLVQVSNTLSLGQLIYTHYLLLFQLSGLILLVAMMGAIVLTLRDKPEARRQNISRQVARRTMDTLAIVNMPLNAGSGAYLRSLDAPVPYALDEVGATNPDLLTHEEPG